MNILHGWKEQDEDRGKETRKRGHWNPLHPRRSRFARTGPAHSTSDQPEENPPHPDCPDQKPLEE